MEKTGITPAMLKAEVSGRGMMAGTPDAIVASEAAGQETLVNSEILPVDMNGHTKAEITEKTGIKFGDMADDIFINATLPEGWTKKASEHSMHNDLLDDKGRVRANIFYKAAFYDRHADMYFKPFYSVGGDYEKHEVKVLNASGDVIKDFGAVDIPDHNDPGWGEKFDEYRKLQKTAKAYLGETYPDHADVFAYWE